MRARRVSRKLGGEDGHFVDWTCPECGRELRVTIQAVNAGKRRCMDCVITGRSGQRAPDRVPGSRKRPGAKRKGT